MAAGITGVLILGCFFIYPMLNEQAGGVCQALERRAVALTLRQSGPENPLGTVLANALAQAFLDGSLAAGLVKQRYPAVPPFIGCSLAYWSSMFNPTGLQIDPNAVRL